MTIRLSPTPLSGVFVVQADVVADARGAMARLFCSATLARHGIDFAPVQTSLVQSPRRATLRGMHLQEGDAAETKLVHCVAGVVFDVALDLRRESATFRQAFGMELRAADGKGLLVARGCAHGVMTLTDDAALLYQIDRDYAPERASGVRWNDPAFDIAWPSQPAVMSDRDKAWPDFSP
jgi:dTDP-4-dehydrorhamnose 3,5-epimerase